MNSLRIRQMRPDEISIAVNWATAEGWNPGFANDACFAAADPEGFFIGELEGAPAATVSCVNYGASFAFRGFYIVREDLRGRGYGLRVWNAAIAHAGSRVIGLDGVLAQQQNYTKAGFELAYANVQQWVSFDCGRLKHWKMGGSGLIFREWRQLSDAIAAPSTNALKQSS